MEGDLGWWPCLQVSLREILLPLVPLVLCLDYLFQGSKLYHTFINEIVENMVNKKMQRVKREYMKEKRRDGFDQYLRSQLILAIHICSVGCSCSPQIHGTYTRATIRENAKENNTLLVKCNPDYY